jgi:malonyl CoA-acyl carrier protein transacylase
LSENHLAFIFPAFTNDYNDHPARNMPGFGDRFREFLLKASGSVDPELAGFQFNGPDYLNDELRTQYMTYIYSCTAASLLRDEGFNPGVSAGYSMGIYAALFDAGAVSFETGLELIRFAYQCLRESLQGGSFGMGTIIGLDRKDIQHLIDRASLQIEITNQNAGHAFVVSGNRDDIHNLMEMAKEDGALHIRDLAVSVPYHSHFSKNGALDFARQISHLEFSTPGTPVISLVDQVLLRTPEIIRLEVTRNLFHPLNWMQTMHFMLENRFSQFIECGPSAGLARNARFVDGNYRFYPLNSLPKTSFLP